MTSLKREFYILSLVWFVLPFVLGATAGFVFSGFHLPSVLYFTIYAAAFLAVPGPVVSIGKA